MAIGGVIILVLVYAVVQVFRSCRIRSLVNANDRKLGLALDLLYQDVGGTFTDAPEVRKVRENKAKSIEIGMDYDRDTIDKSFDHFFTFGIGRRKTPN